MFSTKEDSKNWIKCFGKGRGLTTRKNNKYWRIYDKNGYILCDCELDRIEDKK